MKKRTYFLAILAVITFSLTSCRDHVLRGEGAKKSKTINVAPFTSLEVSINSIATITVQPGAQPSVEVYGYENHLEHVLTKVENNKLTIFDDLKPHWSFGRRKELEFKITVSSLEELSLDGATDAAIHGNLTGKTFSVDGSGAVRITIDSMNVTDFKADLSGAGDININGGSAQTAAYEVSGAAKILAFQFRTVATTTSISGAGKAEVNASGTLNVDISGAGKVRYKGHPVITKDISGAGSISDAN